MVAWIINAGKPILRISQLASDNIYSFFQLLKDTRDLNREIMSLREENASLKILVAQYLDAYRQNQRLIEFFNIPELLVKGQVARITGMDPENWSRGFIIDKGTDDMVFPGFGVINNNPYALVGVIVFCYPNLCRVRLITDINSMIPVYLGRSRVKGFLEGGGEDHCRLRFLRKEYKIYIDERVYTSGMSGIFPPGVPVGTVVAAKKDQAGIFYEVEVKPMVDLTKCEEVLIIQPLYEIEKLFSQVYGITQ